MYILLDAREAHTTTGTGNVIRELYPAIVKNDKNNRYAILYTKEDPFPELKCEKIKSPKDNQAKFTYIWQLFFLPHFLNKKKFDVFFSVENLVMPLFFKGVLIISILDIIPYALKDYYKKPIDNIKYKVKLFLLKFMKKKDLIYTISQYSKSDIHKYLKIDNSKIIVIENSIIRYKEPKNTKEILRKMKINKPYILSIGGGEKRKNNLRLIEAFNGIKTNMDLIVVGKIDGRNDAAQFDDLPTSKNIKTPGKVDQDTLVALYKNAHAFIFLSYYEGFGLPPLEAMKFNVPVLCADRTSLPEVCRDGVLYADPFDIEDIKDKLITLIDNKEIREDLKKKGKMVLNSYSWDNAAKEMIAAIENIKK